jgi:hypothetical protein
MMVSREEFICRYMEKLNHKVIMELKEQLPAEGFIAELQPQADAIVHSLTKEV